MSRALDSLLKQDFLSCRSLRALHFALTIASIFLFASAFLILQSSSAYSSNYLHGSPKVILRPFTVSPGKTDQVTGINFSPDSTVTVTFAGGNNIVATTQANSTGGFVAQFTVAQNTPIGLYPVVATDNSGSKLSGENILTIASLPKITLSTAGKAHIVGVIVAVNGNGFSAGKSVRVFFKNQMVGSTTTTSAGAFVISFSVPSLPAGTYTVNATDGTNVALKTFVLNPHLIISPNTGATIGEKITLIGSGYSANSPVHFTFGGSPTASKVMTKADGSFSIQIGVPNVPKGGYTLTGTDSNGLSAKGRVGVAN
jgi:hypothetical protein